MIIFIIYNIRIYKKEIKYKLFIDAFTYYQESVMLSIRLTRMSKYVDIFLIITSNITYSGLPLKVSFSPFESIIEKYRKKIIFYNFTFPLLCRKARRRENYQRIVTADAVESLNISKESVIIISDVDEIPTDNAMKYIKKYPPKKLYILKGFFFYYNYRNKFKFDWFGTIVIKALYLKKNIQSYRNNRNILYINYSIPVFPSLTHCSYCYNNISMIQKKLHSFAHTEYNKPPYTERNYIVYSIKNHLDIFRKNKLEVVDYDKNLLPLPNDKRFKYLTKLYDFI